MKTLVMFFVLSACFLFSMPSDAQFWVDGDCATGYHPEAHTNADDHANCSSLGPDIHVGGYTGYCNYSSGNGIYVVRNTSVNCVKDQCEATGHKPCGTTRIQFNFMCDFGRDPGITDTLTEFSCIHVNQYPVTCKCSQDLVTGAWRPDPDNDC